MCTRRHVALALLLVLSFVTLLRAAPPALDDPLIKGIHPTRAQQGRQVLIRGVNFGTNPEVRFAGVLATVEAYRPDLGALITAVPAGASSGEVTVRNQDLGRTSNGAAFTRLAGVYTPSCTISGLVRDPSLAPLPGAIVVGMLRDSEEMPGFDVTDVNGQYSLGLDPAGDYRLLFIAPEGSSYHTDKSTATCSGTADHTFALGHRVTGRVIDALSNPVRNAWVVVGDDTDNDFEALTDAAGDFALRAPSSTYTVHVQGPVGGRHVSQQQEDVAISADTDLGTYQLADGVLVEGLLEAQDDAVLEAAMNAAVLAGDSSEAFGGSTTSIANGSFFLPVPNSETYTLQVSAPWGRYKELIVATVPVSGDTTLAYPARVSSRAAQLPWRPEITQADAVVVEVGQRIAFEATHLAGSSHALLFPDGMGGWVPGVDTLAELDRGALVTTVPALASTGDVILRIDGVDSPGYPMTVSGTYLPGPFTTTGSITATDCGAPVENAFVALLGTACDEEEIVDYDLTDAAGAYAVEHPAGDHHLLVLPPVSSSLASRHRPLPGMTGGQVVDLALDRGHVVTARCIDSGVGVVGGSDVIPDCWVEAEGLNVDHEEDAQAGATAALQLNLPTGLYEIAVGPPFRSRYVQDGSSEQSITEDTDFGDVELDSGLFLEGRVVDPVGNGLVGVEVSAVNPWGDVHTTDTTGPDGRFVVALPAGEYDLYFDIHRDHDYYVRPLHDLVVGQDLLLYPALVAEAVDTVEGAVTNELSAPLGGVPVRAWHETHGVVAETRSCADGSYTLRVPAGNTTVEARPVDEELCYADEFYDNHYAGCGADTLAVAVPGGATGIDFQLEPAGTITGQLTDDTGAPLAGATICAEAGDTVPYCLSLCRLSESDGHYELPGVPESSDVKVQAFGLGLPAECWDDHVGCQSYDPVAAHACATTPDISFLMSRNPGPVPDGKTTAGTQVLRATTGRPTT